MAQKYLIIIAVFLNSIYSFSQTTLYSEDFEGIHNWSLSVSTGANGSTPNVWEVNDSEGGVMPPACGGNASNGDKTLHVTCTSLFCGSFITGSLYNATQASNIRAESPSFSTIGYTDLLINFDFIANGDGLLDNASVWYDAGSGWTLLDSSLKSILCGGGQGQWTAKSIVLPVSVENKANVKVGFNWTNNNDNIGTDPSVAINNVIVLSQILSTSNYNLDSQINLYPNPSNGNVNIMVNNLTNISVSVYDLNGRQILNKELSANENTVDISKFQTGMYLFRIISSEGEVVKKVIKN